MPQGSCVENQHTGGDVTCPEHNRSTRSEVKDPVEQDWVHLHRANVRIKKVIFLFHHFYVEIPSTKEKGVLSFDVSSLATDVNASVRNISYWSIGRRACLWLVRSQAPRLHMSATLSKPEEVATSASWSIFVRRGELMFSSASLENNAQWHMTTLALAGLKRAARSRSKTTSRTWSPIGEEKLKDHPCTFISVLITRR
ncbi:hypothetical protein DPEC_G00350640 [Dallia pectoralis]|uniref:Uncharacterized protein n=1 Tax=Dallia pectoralis TaxID=75939 RepID=A0ACC2F1V7_DALPE|nr:hypothetical protein DPEC_G00350640 [Dallia pectoralis]